MTALATDNFSAAVNGSELTTWDSNWTYGTASGPPNNQMNGVTGGTIKTANDAADLGLYWNATTWPDNQYSQAKITCSATGYTLSDGPGLSVRNSPSVNTRYRAIVTHITGSNNVDIAKRVNGIYTSLGGRNSGAWTDGATWYLEVSGTTLLVKLNGTQVGSTATDSATATGSAGLAYSAEGSGVPTCSWDDWEGGDLGAAVVTLPLLPPLTQVRFVR
jgi:hypothetical protein